MYGTRSIYKVNVTLVIVILCGFVGLARVSYVSPAICSSFMGSSLWIISKKYTYERAILTITNYMKNF